MKIYIVGSREVGLYFVRGKNEIETLNSTLVRFAKEKNIDVPINEMIYGAIKILNKK